MSTQTLEFITDAELQAASGGGLFGSVVKGLGKWAAKNPGKVVDAVTDIADAATSKGQLQDLQLGMA